jgi:hypothetical protein
MKDAIAKLDTAKARYDAQFHDETSTYCLIFDEPIQMGRFLVDCIGPFWTMQEAEEWTVQRAKEHYVPTWRVKILFAFPC